MVSPFITNSKRSAGLLGRLALEGLELLGDGVGAYAVGDGAAYVFVGDDAVFV